jgi:hypothetical protein
VDAVAGLLVGAIVAAIVGRLDPAGEPETLPLSP